MQENISLFTGEERYMLQQELLRWKKGFCEKYGAQNLFVFHADELDRDRIQQALLWGGMFATKTMVIIYGILKEGEQAEEIPSKSKIKPKPKPNSPEQIAGLLEQYRNQISPDTILVIVSYKPDKRTKWYKFFAKHAVLKEFKQLWGVELKTHIRKLAGEMKLSEENIDLIIDIVGTDTSLLANEIAKLRSLVERRWLTTLSPELIKYVCYPQAETNSFLLLDTLLTDRKQAISVVEWLQADQQVPFQFLGMLYRGIKLMLQMADLHDQGMTNSKELASTLKMHPFAVSKQLKLLPQIKAQRPLLAHLFHELLVMDSDIKSGILPLEFFWLHIKRLLMTTKV